MIHIHEVLELLNTTEKNFTVGELKSELANRYGENVTFNSCADHEFGIDEAVLFMQSRNKIVLEGDLIIPTKAGSTC